MTQKNDGTQAPLTVSVYPRSGVWIGGSGASYLHPDQLASVQVINNAAGQRAIRQQHRPFGELPWEVVELVTSDGAHGFIGERYDIGAGLQSLNARHYDPELGMFVPLDWLEVMQAGVRNNTRYSDMLDPTYFDYYVGQFLAGQ